MLTRWLMQALRWSPRRLRSRARYRPARRKAGYTRHSVEALEPRLLLAATISVGTNVNISRKTGSEAEASITVDPVNPNRMAAFSNEEASTAGVFAAFSTDGGSTWVGRVIGDGTDGLPLACCDTQAVFDRFGNLFVTYAGFTGGVAVLQSTNGGLTFSTLRNFDSLDPDVDQPSIAVGPNSVWVSYTNSVGQVVAGGASVLGLGQVSPFGELQSVPNALGNFGDIAVGPLGQVTVIYQDQGGAASGPGLLFVSIDQDGIGSGGFTSPILFSMTNVGTQFTGLPGISNTQGIDAEANLAWDVSNGPNRGRLYGVYTDSPGVGSINTDIYVRYSNDGGINWSARVKVNDDATTGSQFLPAIAVDQSTGYLAVAWYDTRNDQTDALKNNDAQLFAGFSIDGGLSFLPNVQVSAGTSNSAASGITNEKGYGDFIVDKGAFVQGVFHPIWADNSNSTGNNPQGARSGLDLYTAPVTLTVTSSTTEAFVIGSGDGQVYEQRLNADGTPNGSPFLVAPGQVKSLVAGKFGTGNDMLFVQGLDDQVYVLTFSGTVPSPAGYVLTQAGAVKSLALTSYGTSSASPALFVIGQDDQVYFKLFDAAGAASSGYALIPGAVNSIAVSAPSAGPFLPTLFSVGLDGQVYEQRLTSSGTLSGSYFLTQPGAVLSIDAARTAAGNPMLFAIGLDNQVYSQSFDASGTSAGYALVNAGGVKSIASGNDPTTNRPELFAIGFDDQLYAAPYNSAGSPAPYALTRPGAVKSVVTGHTGSNLLFILAIGLDDQVYAQTFNSAGVSITPYFLAVPGSVLVVEVAD